MATRLTPGDSTPSADGRRAALASPPAVGLLVALEAHFWYILAAAAAVDVALIEFLYLFPALVPVFLGLVLLALFSLVLLHALLLNKVYSQDRVVYTLGQRYGMVDSVDDSGPEE